MRIDVKDYVRQMKESIKNSSRPGYCKKLLIIQIGNNEASNRYINGKIKDCADVGHYAVLAKFPEGVSAGRVRAFLQREREFYNGIILQEPANMDESGGLKKEEVIELISPEQDVDGFKRDSKHNPCTPLGIVNFLKYYLSRGDLKGLSAAVVGKGKLVGGPLVPMLMAEGATVISCNSQTADLGSMTQMADIVISCTGVPALIKKGMLKKGAIVIDAGIAFDEDGKICGDCDKALYDDEDVYVTTVPGGVGLLTRLALLENLRRA